ncbi:hypothetical protein G3O08_06995 [Cryomorpha ignava]|uniref:DUF4890 domain-containing protein n=1 Tax=Cryomorpha ignava TaxID=101383 RepID=A0A7K3WRA6_9FLAO|nr:hypothetical protein [Cryomorpha ignava]NEN23245.1 hypothetical protein [Cryomorpha ignava]
MKTLVTIIALSAATVFSAQAQDTQRANKKAVHNVQEQPQQTPADQAKAQTDRMTRDLNLTAEQSKQLMERNTTYYSDVANMSKKDVAERDAMMSKSMDKYDSDLQNIFDDTQYERYSTMKDDYMMDMKSNQMDQAPMNKDMKRDDNMRK